MHFFNTFFYKKLAGPTEERANYDYKGVKRWLTRRACGGYDITRCEKLVVPIHQEAHWVATVIDLVHHRLTFLDSLAGGPRRYLVRALGTIDRAGSDALCRGGRGPIGRGARSAPLDVVTGFLEESAALHLPARVYRAARAVRKGAAVRDADPAGVCLCPPKHSPASQKHLARFVDDLFLDQRSGPVLGAVDWETSAPADIPQQSNFVDCGVFLLCFAEAEVIRSTTVLRENVSMSFHAQPQKLTWSRAQSSDQSGAGGGRAPFCYSIL